MKMTIRTNVTLVSTIDVDDPRIIASIKNAQCRELDNGFAESKRDVVEELESSTCFDVASVNSFEVILSA